MRAGPQFNETTHRSSVCELPPLRCIVKIPLLLIMQFKKPQQTYMHLTRTRRDPQREPEVDVDEASNCTADIDPLIKAVAPRGGRLPA